MGFQGTERESYRERKPVKNRGNFLMGSKFSGNASSLLSFLPDNMHKAIKIRQGEKAIFSPTTTLFNAFPYNQGKFQKQELPLPSAKWECLVRASHWVKALPTSPRGTLLTTLTADRIITPILQIHRLRPKAYNCLARVTQVQWQAWTQTLGYLTLCHPNVLPTLTINSSMVDRMSA